MLRAALLLLLLLHVTLGRSCWQHGCTGSPAVLLCLVYVQPQVRCIVRLMHNCAVLTNIGIVYGVYWRLELRDRTVTA